MKTITRHSKLDLLYPLQLQPLARLGGRRDLERELLEDAADLRDLLGVAGRELALADVDAVLEAHAHVATADARHRGERHLVAARGEHRPLVAVAEKLVSHRANVHHVV